MKIRCARVALAAAAASLLTVAIGASAAELSLKPTTQQAEAMLWTARVLDRYRTQPEGAAARRPVHEAYLAALDPERMLFTQADIAAFQSLGATLDKDVDKPGMACLRCSSTKPCR